MLVGWLRHQLRNVSWWLRGLIPETYRAVYARCGYTGQVHLLGCGCRRFRRPVTGTDDSP
jgi:hypothetical protein